MEYFVGIDIGSTTIKIAIINEGKELVAKRSSPTGSRFNQNAVDALDLLLFRNNIKKEEIVYTVSTGYGRKLFKASDENVNELTANAVGAMASQQDGVKIRTIINVGGQDTKVILLNENGDIRNFVMNDKCAAGTGRFLDIAARNLEVDIIEMEGLHFEAKDSPLPVNSTCAVFAESEIISLLAAGHHVNEIVSGIHYSIARRIARLAARGRIEDDVLFDGGTALNKGMVDALENELMRKIYIHPHPQFTTAIGSAHIALKKFTNERV